MQLSYYYAIILLGILVFFSVNGILGKVVFGYGLGDVAFLLILWGITLIYFITFLLIRKNPTGLMVTSFLFTIPTIWIILMATIWIILMATIWRSVEYSWNGEIFYIPCRTEIQIENEKVSKKEILTMCTMTYYSEFIGIWNGQEIEKINGEIKIPQKLKKYIDYPIQNILIQPNYMNLQKNGINTKVYDFSLDTLKANKEYQLKGEIIRIVGRKPVIQARIK